MVIMRATKDCTVSKNIDGNIMSYSFKTNVDTEVNEAHVQVLLETGIVELSAEPMPEDRENDTETENETKTEIQEDSNEQTEEDVEAKTENLEEETTEEKTE